MPSNALPAITGDKDLLIQQALGRLSASPKPTGPDADPIVTAMRRLPAAAATYAPFPEEASPSLFAPSVAFFGSADTSRAATSGSVTQNVAPLPAPPLSARTVPPWRSTM